MSDLEERIKTLERENGILVEACDFNSSARQLRTARQLREKDAEIAKLKQMLKHEVEDWAFTDTRIKDLAAPFVSVEGPDFVGVIEVVERLVAYLKERKLDGSGNPTGATGIQD